MQSKGSMLIFLAILAFPVIAISANHNLFFAVFSAIITMVSFKSIFHILSGSGFDSPKPDEELEAELEELANIDLKKAGIGLSIVFNLLVILYLFYCSFYLNTPLLKGFTALAILFQAHFIIKKAGYEKKAYDRNNQKLQILFSSLCNLIIVIFAVLNKLLRVI